MIQEGIFYQQGSKPGAHWGILILRVKISASSESVYPELNKIWKIVNRLKLGTIEDLPNIVLPVPESGLQVTIGYGKNIFSRPGIKQSVPEEFNQSNFRSALATGGGKLLLASGLNYSSDVVKNPATEDIALQFICDSELIIYRCYLEIYKFLSKQDNFNEYPLEIVKFYTGFQREDKRSWIDFHDGISNLKSGDERLDAIKIKDVNSQNDKWTLGGTFLAFIRIEVNIDKWIRIDANSQNTIVGRDKITGCPIEKIINNIPTSIKSCPITGSTSIIDTDSQGNFVNSEFFETPITNDTVVLKSHVQRANHHRAPISQKDSLRIFRQGYEFFESSDHNANVKVGLNFVSFQDTPERLIRILTQDTWLGNTNFGGEENDQDLLKIWAAGIYLIPPVTNSGKIPGFEMFEEAANFQ